MTTEPRIRILFICMGNLCRSPLAENIFRYHANKRGVVRQFDIDSAGTGHWHVGEKPDQRVCAVARDHGIPMTGTARQVDQRDFKAFDYLICMDEDNRDNLLAMGAPADKVWMLLSFDGQAPMEEVPDPYYGGPDGFELVHGLVDRACAALLDFLLQQPLPDSSRTARVDST